MNLFTFNFKKYCTPFIVAVIIFIGGQWVLFNSSAFWKFSYFYAKWGYDDPLRFEAMLQMMPDDEEIKKVFILGTSQARQDFDVEFLNEKFKDQNVIFYNFGVAGTAQPIDLFMARNKLLAQKPDMIIYMPFVETFYSKYMASGHNHLKFFFTPEIVPYFFEYLDRNELYSFLDDAFEAGIGKFVPLLKFREQVNSVLTEAVKSKVGIEKRTGPVIYPFWEDEDEEHFIAEIEKSKGDRFRYTQYTPLNEKLFRLAAKDFLKAGVDFLVITGPTHPLITQTYKEDVGQSYERFLQKNSEELGFVYLPSSRQPEFEFNEFIDFTHLNANGRGRFTEFVGQYIMEDYPGNGYSRLVQVIENNKVTVED